VPEPTNNMRSLERAFDVLAVLQGAKQPLRLAEIARASGLHIATAQRIVNVLVGRGYAARSGDAYTGGPAALAVAHAFVVSNPLSLLAQPILQQLAVKTEYTASLYVRVERGRVLVARVESQHPLNYLLPVGERLPLHLGGAGKMFLAEMTAPEVDDALAGIGSISLADGRTVNVDELRNELKQIHDDGYAVTIAERQVGVGSVTAPVLADDGTMLAAMTVTCPAEVLNEAALMNLIAEVRRAAGALGARVPGFR